MVSAAAYIRVSTDKQDLGLQRHAIRQAAAARGDRIAPGRWFQEKRSGATTARPELQRLRDAVRAGRVGRLYVFKLDRLSRSGIRDTLSLVDELRHGGCELVTLADAFDLSGPMAEPLIAMLAWCAQFERNAIGERIKAARARIEAEGGRWGRPRRIDPGTLELARGLHQVQSLREVAQALKIPRATLSDALAGRGHYARAASRTAKKVKRRTRQSRAA